MVKAEAQLWHSVLKLLERINTISYLENHPAVVLGQIISESALVLANFRYVAGEDAGATEFIRQLQTQNRALQGVESNPFMPAESPVTCRILERAMALANANDRFRVEYYLPVVGARMSLVSCLKEQKSRSYNQNKMVRQGRKQAKK